MHAYTHCTFVQQRVSWDGPSRAEEISRGELSMAGSCEHATGGGAREHPCGRDAQGIWAAGPNVSNKLTPVLYSLYCVRVCVVSV